MNAGMLRVYRETLDTSLRLGVDAMRLLGLRAYTAQRLAHTFFKYDEKNLKQLAAIHNQEEYIIEARKNIEELELIIQSDNAMSMEERDGDWDSQSLREEVRNMQ
jgi:hypothetical protein